MKENNEKQLYFIDDFTAEELQYKTAIAISVLEDYVLMLMFVIGLINSSTLQMQIKILFGMLRIKSTEFKPFFLYVLLFEKIIKRF